MRTLRESLWAKFLAAILFAALSIAAVFSAIGTSAVWEGMGVSNNFYDDPLCRNSLKSAMYTSLTLVQTESRKDELIDQLTYRYSGFAYEVWDGDPMGDGVLLLSGGDTSGNLMVEETIVETNYDIPDPLTPASDGEDAETEATYSHYYTIIGRLGSIMPRNSVFHSLRTLWNILHPLRNILPILTAASILGAFFLLVFLLSAAGHKKGKAGITPHWQDKIPIDLYAAIVSTLVICLIFMVDEAKYNFNRSAYGFNAPAFTGLIFYAALAVLLLLNSVISLATRIKLGKWWRNSLCYCIFRWLKRLWHQAWNAIDELIRTLPFTWRSIAMAAGILFLQSFFVILFCLDGDFIPFILLAGWDIALILGACRLSVRLQQLRDEGRALAQGNLDIKIDTSRMRGDLKEHGENLNAIGDGMTKAVEQRLRSERLKTELITNVSHDIKTPLTSIVNYVDLLKKENLPATATEYLQVLERQSRRLKKLTEDLVEASKASTGNVSVSLEPILVNELVHQAIGDYSEKLEAGRLETIVNSYEGNLVAQADGRLLWRVLDNLLGNVCKYALAGTRVYVDLGCQENQATLSIKNISRDPLNISADELIERFVRGDASRHTEGSGLGLNIARSLMNLMGGEFSISVDGDLFKAELALPVRPPDSPLIIAPSPEKTGLVL